MANHRLKWRGYIGLLICVLISPEALGEQSSPDYPTVNFSARIHADAALHHKQLSSDDGVKLKRLRTKAYGQVTDALAYELDMGFADEWRIKDLWLAYQGLGQTSFKLGQYKTPFNLEELTSSNDIMFIERALPNALAPQRKMGVSLATSHIDADNSFTASAGLFDNATITDDHNRLFSDSHLVIGRATFTHRLNEQNYLHLGLAPGWIGHLDNEDVAISSTPESGVTNVTLVDTGSIQGAQDQELIGLEGMANWHSLLVQSEYIATVIDRQNHDNVFFDGWYINAGWIIAGEQHPYNSEQAVIEGVLPQSPYGAWEIAGRYSMIDLNDHDIHGGLEHNITLGINWYPVKCCRFMANYINVDASRDNSKVKTNIASLRLQITWPTQIL